MPILCQKPAKSYVFIWPPKMKKEQNCKIFKFFLISQFYYFRNNLKNFEKCGMM